MTRFDKSQLPRTQCQGWLFTTTQFLHQWTNNPFVYHYHCFPGLLFLGFVSRAVWCARVLGWSSNGSGVNRQAPTQLEIAKQLAKKLGHQIGYYLWYLELNGPQMRPDSVNFYTWKNLPLPWLPTIPYLHPYMIICDSGVNLSKMVGNSASCLLKSWLTERHCITMD